MRKLLLIAGLIVIIIGVVLLGTFPWAFYKSAKDINSENYQEGAKVTVYGVITDVDYSPLLNKTMVELDGNLTVIFDGKVNDFKVGDYVLLSMVKTPLVKIGHWEMSYWHSSVKDVHYIKTIQLYFYAIIALGIILALIAAFLR